MEHPFAAVVLAGERPGGSDFSRELGLPASVLVDVAGKSSLARVIGALEASASVQSGVLCGPEASVYQENPEFGTILEGTSFAWTAPKDGPSASAVAGIVRVGHFPVLLTAGDHALLTPAIIDDFCGRASALDVDVAVGLAPYALVREAFPESKRTVLKFSDGSYCGTNLFAILTRKGTAAPAFWSRLEADRKRPLRMLRRMGIGLLLQYFLGRLTLDRALQRFSKVTGCRVGYLRMEEPRVAVDVDSVADRDLAEKILRQAAGSPDS